MIDSYCRMDRKECGCMLPASGFYLMIVLLIASIFRGIACLNSPVINPDGALYIHQAKAIHYGQWKSLTSCGLSYVSNYPILIAAAYYVVQDWILTGRIISCIFGIAAIFPLWLTARRFFEERITILLTLIFAVMPMFVSSSADIIRDPIAWFFTLWGIYFFIAASDRTFPIFFILSCLSFIMAVWARIETLLFPIITVIYIGWIENQKTKKILMFISPILIGGTIVILIGIVSGISVNKFNRIREIPEKLTGTIVEYQELRKELKEISTEYHNERLGFFLAQARKNIWLIALGSLITQMPEAFFHPFFLIFIIGMIGLWKRIAEEPLILYFILLIVSSVLLLYIHTLHKWIPDHRFFAILIFPSMIVKGFGLERIFNFSARRFPDKDMRIIGIIALMIIAVALPKNLKNRDEDKLVFKDIGEYIAAKETHRKEILISASAHTQRWVSFYANLDYDAVSCSEALPEVCWEFFPNDYEGFMNELCQNHIRYLLWVEKHWSKRRFDFFNPEYHKSFKALKRWKHADTGDMILFQVIE